MTPDQLALWQRIEAHALDDSAATLPFSLRLAKENRWPLSFTRRAIAEYRRFAFLAVAAGHPVSPPNAIDQVWHLHLLYTHDYWGEFCPRVLCAPLHHGPTRGGAAETGKFADWYARTLASYRSFFGEPPADIWPALALHPRAAHVNLEENWVIPKPRFLATLRARSGPPRTNDSVAPATTKTAAPTGLSAATLAIATFAMLLPQRIEAAERWPWPFELAGPEFLPVFFWGTFVIFALAFGLRWYASGPPGVAPRQPEPLDAYETAHLAGGKARVFTAVLAKLCNDGLIALAGREAQRTKSPAPKGAPVIESVVLAVIPEDGKSVRAVRNEVDHALEANAATLGAAGLMVTPAMYFATWLTPLLVAMLSPLLGVTKIFIGLDRGRPVGYLVMMTFVATIGALVMFCRRPRLTRRGRAVLNRLEVENARLRYLNDTTLEGSQSDVLLPMAIGLFGVDVLAGTALADVSQQLRPVRDSSSWNDSSSGCSSSDSSAGGDGGGGGGDGGGGGCGGCGGGGGD